MTHEELIINVQGYLEDTVKSYGGDDAFTREIQSIIGHIDYHLAISQQ